MRIVRVSARQANGVRDVSVRSNDGRIYFVHDDGKKVELNMGGNMPIGTFDKARGEYIKRSPIVIELIRNRILEEGWIK